MNLKLLAFAISAVLFLTACGSAPVSKPAVSNARVAPPPIPASPERIEKPVNVSFSTYSKEWPVGWQFIDPEEKYNPTPHDVKKGVLRIRLVPPKDLTGDVETAPRYVKAITGDFQIETHVNFLPKENYQGAGLLIYRDEKNYIRFERAYGGIGGGGEGLRIDVRNGEEYKPIVTPNEITTDLAEMDMKIVRLGRLFTAYWREDESSEWREAEQIETDYPETILAGVAACNTAREITAEFGYIRLLPTTAATPVR